MDWNRSNAIGLALASCTQCEGHGMRDFRGSAERPCSCVFRAVFRACYRRFREFASQGVPPGAVSLTHVEGPIGKRMYSLKREEFMADFCLITRRALSDNDYRIFRYTFLLGADWILCCKRLNMDRGTYYHHVYRIQGILGRNFAEMRPYPLYPLDEYLGGHIRKEVATELRESMPKPRLRLRGQERLPLTA
jgi:hypothetical protein